MFSKTFLLFCGVVAVLLPTNFVQAGGNSSFFPESFVAAGNPRPPPPPLEEGRAYRIRDIGEEYLGIVSGNKFGFRVPSSDDFESEVLEWEVEYVEDDSMVLRKYPNGKYVGTTVTGSTYRGRFVQDQDSAQRFEQHNYANIPGWTYLNAVGLEVDNLWFGTWKGVSNEVNIVYHLARPDGERYGVDFSPAYSSR